MKKRLISLIGFLILGATLPALAGPDWQVIEHARQAKHGPQTEGRVETVKLAAAGPQKCPPAALVLPLDHGQRAQSTPYLNKLRKERFDAEMTACRGGSK
ncbi:MAG: hypothetical protein ABIR56_16600 [Polaromonas sp.]